MFYITDLPAFNLNARGRKEYYGFKSCKSQRPRKLENRKKTVPVSSLAVKADGRHRVQFVQRNTAAHIFHCLKATNKLGESQSYFIRYHLELRCGSVAGQSKQAMDSHAYPLQMKLISTIFHNTANSSNILSQNNIH